ncbi:uncharacterized protein [Dysidea avara]|uniref:uncharacterized protein isoform X2 n=1 Tax=Dysidea avara TaxID=196820 RepID=UPI003333785D
MKLACIFVLLAYPTVSDTSYGVDLCTRPSPDPCFPGGKWDPLLNRCHGVGEQDCYQCFSGEHCQKVSSLKECHIQSLAGNPEVLAEYWTTNSSYIPCLSIPADYHPAYQDKIFPPIEAAIKQLHTVVKNAEIDGYTIVYGVGATNLLYVAIIALSRSIINKCVNAGRTDCPSAVDVFVQTPFYPGYPLLIEYISTTNWNPQANTSSEFSMEIVTLPNNPDGEPRKPLVKDRSHVMYDMVYYWPMFTNVSVKMSEDIMIFSASKHDALAGSRFGWGLVKDVELAKSMNDVNEAIVYTMPEDAVLRTYNTMSSILKEDPSPVTGMLPYHEFGRKKIFTAFSRLSEAMENCKIIKLLNDGEHSPGAYAWLKCADGVNCTEKIKELAGIEGLAGTEFGASDNCINMSRVSNNVMFILLIY